MLLDLEQFEKMWLGKVCRDGQCVALFRQYAQDCYGIPHTGSVEGAVDLWTKFSPVMNKYFKQVNRPEVGDAAIFAPTDTNKYGHVAIITAVHDDGIEVLEQDGFKLNGVKPGFWTLTRYMGSLHCKEAKEWV